MRSYDFSPLMRSSIGFDRIEEMFRGLERATNTDKFPPYNIIKKDADNYRITMAVAGFSQDDIEITATQNELKITGQSQQDSDGQPQEYLHKGIAGRSFTQKFELADTIEVVGASMENGLLHIDLLREIPEAHKPRTIKIGSQALLENKAA
ncbi:Hsp20 family protein [Sneathiella chinensis]|uniref:Molecular chaperone Hsp20 n=1 Tax=Sneathiella chinensis TaxID=349750 RepID=A0ABQ5U4X9_9PROT|nr:Hsp20 family protein [Sneathiella chinensis]GLQ06303.1 molecular chaperone Hsp20 [Sneathiella chinensis]